MKLVILGCGTSTGVPVIGCNCEVCSSTEPGNRRTRASALVETQGKSILIDTATDLRAQSLACRVTRIDAVLYTHSHADHIHGIDELRAFNHAQGSMIPCYGGRETVERIRTSFDYIFKDRQNGGWKPRLSITAVDSTFEAAGVPVTPVPVIHGQARILGYRIGDAAYVTDCSAIPPESVEKLKGLKVLVLGALRHTPHPTHFNVAQAVEAAAALAPERTVLTHLGHNLDYRVDNDGLPAAVELAYDGMVIEV